CGPSVSTHGGRSPATVRLLPDQRRRGRGSHRTWRPRARFAPETCPRNRHARNPFRPRRVHLRPAQSRHQSTVRPPLGQCPIDFEVFAQAGVTRENVQGFYTYDAFSPLVLLALERFGYCGAGEAAAWVQGGRIELGGALPVNTSGGLLSEAHVAGWNSIC